MASIQKQLKNGPGYPLSELRCLSNSSIGQPYEEFTNIDLKIYLHNWLEKNISYSYLPNRRKSCLVFHTDINTAEVVKKIQSSNPTKETAVNIREAVLRKQHIRG